MTKILLCGCNGKMGQFVTRAVDQREDCEIVAGVDIQGVMLSRYPVFTSLKDVTVDPDVIIDFSHPSALNAMISYVSDRHIPVVLCTTGYDEGQTKQIEELSKTAPVFFSFNMSLGINLLLDLVKKATCILADTCDIEIVEAHHNQKLDAPSGTAIMIANAINQTLDEPYELQYDRHSQRQKRPKKEIGMHSIRGGTIVGEHQVIFAGHDELVTISHSARSKEVFAVGAVKAALFMVGQPNGMYQMNDMMK